MQSQEQHRTSKGRRGFFKLLFLVLCAVMTSQLWIGLVGLSPAESHSESGKLDVEALTLNQNARMAIGLGALIDRVGLPRERFEGQLEKIVIGGEQVVLTDRGRWMQLVLYHQLGMETEIESTEELLGRPSGKSNVMADTEAAQSLDMPQATEADTETEPPLGATPGTEEDTEADTLVDDASTDARAGSLSPEADRLLRAVYFNGEELSPEEAVVIVAELGFTGRLVPRILPADENERAPLASELTADAARYVITLVIIVIFAISLLLVGVVLLMLFLVALRAKRISWQFRSEASAAYPLFETFTIFLACFVLIGLAGPWLLPEMPRAPMLPGLLTEVAMFGVIAYPLLHGMTWREIRESLGLTRGKGVLIESTIGIAGYAGGLPIFVVGMVGATLVAKLLGTDVTSGGHPIIPELISGKSGTLNLIMILVLGVLVAPLLEEIMFRGALFGVLRSYLGPAPSMIVSGLLFAAIHPQGWIGLPILGSVGIVLALLREWRDSIIAPFVTHACVNGATLTITLMLLR